MNQKSVTQFLNGPLKLALSNETKSYVANNYVELFKSQQWGTFYLLIANFFVT